MFDTISITDLKQHTSKVIKKVQDKGRSVVILQRSKTVAVLVDPNYYNILEQTLENTIDLKAIKERKNDPAAKFEDYFVKRFGKNAKKRLFE